MSFVNLSPSQLHAELPNTIERVLMQTGLAPRRIAFDDFGTGYASLSHLKRFPMDCLKIDRSFVCDLGIDRNNTAIATSIIELGNRLGLRTIAEGIEDEQCAEWLEKLGYSEGQGYYFGTPMSVGQMQDMLEAQSHVSVSAA